MSNELVEAYREIKLAYELIITANVIMIFSMIVTVCRAMRPRSMGRDLCPYARHAWGK